MKSILGLWSHGDEVKEWQTILGNVKVDGQFGPITHAKTFLWQESHGVHVDGVVGPETWEAGLKFKKKTTKKEPDDLELETIAAVRGIDRLSASDLEALVKAAEAIETEPDYLATVISFETSGTFNPAEPNHVGSGAIGLIQFMPKTAQSLHTTTEDLAAMSFQEQLIYVVRYFQSFKRKFPTLRNLYLAVFWPSGIDKTDEYIIAKKGSKVYEQNEGFDRARKDGTKKGYITRNDVCLVIDDVLMQAEDKPRVLIA